MESPVPSKRKKYFTKEEILQKLSEKEDKINEVSQDICEELCPFDVTDEEAMLMEDRVERMQKVTKAMTAKISKLSKAFKERKFRKCPEKLCEKEISCSQYSLLQSQGLESMNDSPENSQEDTQTEDESHQSQENVQTR